MVQACGRFLGQIELMSDPRLSDALPDKAQALFMAGRLDEAAALYRQRLQEKPQDLEANQALGFIYFQARQFDLAQYFAGEALKLDPAYLDGFRLRGMALMQLGRLAPALQCFSQALALKPDSVELLVNHATALLELKRLDEALAGFDRVVALDPNNAVGWNNRANTLVALKRLEEAATCYERALQIRPDLETARSNRFLVLLQLRKVSRIADFALRDMFDEVATRFDQLMVDGLDYRGHLHLRTLADAKLPPLKPPLRILDLGCGTGLVGDAFKDLAAGGRLDGIDLAPRMIEVARKRGIYDDLILGDLETVLAAPGPDYDLIVSADTMVYLGDLAPTFRGVFNRLAAGGFYLFAVESKTGSGWEQTDVSRFRHSETYLKEEAARCGLDYFAQMDCTLRYEREEPVPGLGVALQKRA
jgi:predicted TPR repeat methyltransferase